LRLLNADALQNVAQTLTACVAALRSGQTVRGMDPLLLLDVRAELFADAAAREQ
jgi:hypothetical protein